MDSPGWLTRFVADVPAGDHWLSDRERRVLAALRAERRRRDWRLGRWTAKCALSVRLDVAPNRIEVLAASNGAPEAWVDGEPASVSISLSHRGGRALVAVADRPQIAGCDLELIEPRSAAFVRQWFAPEEQGLLAMSTVTEQALLANLIWTAKEAATKVLREGLRLDVRRAVVSPDTTGDPYEWCPLQVEWADDGQATTGWWRIEPGWVMVVAAEPPADAPRAIT